MKIVVDISPLNNQNLLKHRVRGTGFYIQNLKKTLLTIDKNNQYVFLEEKNEFPSDTQIVHYPYFEPFFLTLPFSQKYKTIVTVHDLIPFVFPEHFPSGIKGRVKWMIQKKSLQKTDAIITDSYSSKKDIISYGEVDGNKIHVIYLAASEEFKCSRKSKEYQYIFKKYNLPQKFILYVGDATWNKNLPALVEITEKLNIPLVMVGSALTENNADFNNPWNSDLVKVRNKIKTSKNVRALGFIPTTDLVGIYNLATVFVMPSLYEGFGLPALEAMSCGCPVVVGNKGSLPEVVGDAGVYVDPYSQEDIAKGILSVFLNDSTQKELSLKSLNQAKKFNWLKTARQTIQVYEK